MLDELTGHCVLPTSCGKETFNCMILLIIFFLQDTCSLAVSPGPCKGSYPRWFFNSTSRQCELFSYGGCEGNSNRFTSLIACTDKCGMWIISHNALVYASS